MKRKCSKYKKLVEYSFQTLDVYLKKRYELLADAFEHIKYVFGNDGAFVYKVKDILKFDYKTLETNEKIKLNEKIASVTKIIISEADNSEKLINDENYIQFKNKENNLENFIEKTRKEYNHAVNQYNSYIGAVPRCFFTNAFKYNPELLYENFYNKNKYAKLD